MRTVRWRAMVAPAAVLAGLLAAAPAGAATAVPTVTGPLPVTADCVPGAVHVVGAGRC